MQHDENVTGDDFRRAIGEAAQKPAQNAPQRPATPEQRQLNSINEETPGSPGVSMPRGSMYRTKVEAAGIE
jgi:hypothetical protein